MMPDFYDRTVKPVIIPSNCDTKPQYTQNNAKDISKRVVFEINKIKEKLLLLVLLLIRLAGSKFLEQLNLLFPAMDASVLNLYQIDPDGTTIAPVKEVADIVALREKAIPLLIEHLDDNRPSSATFHGGYLPDGSQGIKVPVEHVCLDILLHLVDNSFYLDKKCQIESRLEGCVKDGFYFRPDDYWILGELGSNDFVERPIVRIVKANWQNANRQGRLKYDYKVTWK